MVALIFSFLMSLKSFFQMCVCVHACLCRWPVWYLSNEHEVGIFSDTGASDICVCKGVVEVVPGQAGCAGMKS